MQLVRFFHFANDDISTLLVAVGRAEMMSTRTLCYFRLICRIYIYIERTLFVHSNHFSADLCARLGVQAPPAYINQLAQTGMQATTMMAGFGALAAGFLDAAAQMDSDGHNNGNFYSASQGPTIERLDDD